MQTSEAAQFRDWYLEKGMSIKSVKGVFASVRSIINLNIREYGLGGTNAFSGTYMPDGFDTPKRISGATAPHILKFLRRRCQHRSGFFGQHIDTSVDVARDCPWKHGCVNDQHVVNTAKP